MSLLYSFLIGGFICLIAQIIYEKTKWTIGHITSLLVVVGVLLEFFNLYKYLDILTGKGLSLPIISFGRQLMKGVKEGVNEGFIGIFENVFKYVSGGISFVIFVSVLFTFLFKAKE